METIDKIKYFGCNYFSGHHRQNQNSNKWMIHRLQKIKYSHYKEISVNDDRDYIEAKRFFRKNGFVRQYHYYHLMRCNPFHYSKLLDETKIKL